VRFHRSTVFAYRGAEQRPFAVAFDATGVYMSGCGLTLKNSRKRVRAPFPALATSGGKPADAPAVFLDERPNRPMPDRTIFQPDLLGITNRIVSEVLRRSVTQW
jgi:hypothetical protein